MKQYSTHDNIVVIFGILGNIISFLVFLSPVPTFYNIYKKKSIEGFQSVPYFVALFSSTLYFYYGFLKKDGLYIISINSVGILIESIYLILYVMYAPRKIKAITAMIFLLVNIGLFGSILLVTLKLFEDHRRAHVVGTLCAILSVSVFIAPLCIAWRVIKTKSVEYMPFWLSFFLTLCSVIWFFYGFLIKDFFIAGPNIIGFVFGIAQMVLYMIFKNYKDPQLILPETSLLDMINDTATDEIPVQENVTNGDEPQKEDEDAKYEEMDYDGIVEENEVNV